MVAVATVFLSGAEATSAQNVDTSRTGKIVDLQAASCAHCLAACPRRCEQGCFSFPGTRGKKQRWLAGVQMIRPNIREHNAKVGNGQALIHTTGINKDCKRLLRCVADNWFVPRSTLALPQEVKTTNSTPRANGNVNPRPVH